MHDSTPYAFPISLQAQLESLRSPGANRSKTVRQGTADVASPAACLRQVQDLQHRWSTIRRHNRRPPAAGTASPFRKPSGAPLRDGQPPLGATTRHPHQESTPWRECRMSRRSKKHFRRPGTRTKASASKPPVNDSAAAILKRLVSQYARTAAANSSHCDWLAAASGSRIQP